MNKVLKRFIISILSLPLAICAFASEPIEGMAIEDYPMGDGSSSTRSIQSLLACKILGVPYCWYINHIGNMGIQTIVPYSPNGEYTSEQITEIVRRTQYWGAWYAIDKLLSAEVDMAFLNGVSKELLDSSVEKSGVEITEITIGLDGLAILVNDDNPVKSLSIDQLQGIFSGEITNWKEVGGNDTIIRLYLPSIGAGGRDVFEEVVMRGKPFSSDFKEFSPAWTNSDTYSSIDYWGNSITFASSSFYYLSVIKKKCHPVAIDGIEPTLQAVKDGSYPLRAPLKMVTRVSLDIAPTTWDVINYALSPAGQQAVEECGYAAVETTLQPSAALDRARILVNGRTVMLEKGGEVVSARAYSLDGRLASTAQASDGTVSICGIPAGAYIITATFADGQSCAAKICCL